MTKMNQLNSWTEADHYSVFLGGLMDELIVKFKNLLLAKKPLLSSRVPEDWICSVLAVAAGDEGESGYGHWSEHQDTGSTMQI